MPPTFQNNRSILIEHLFLVKPDSGHRGHRGVRLIVLSPRSPNGLGQSFGDIIVFLSERWVSISKEEES